MIITAGKLYDYLYCPHKVWRDLYGPQDEKIQETNPFVKLLWERGVLHEEKIVEEIGEFTDISQGSYDQRFKGTISEMQKGTNLIYQGVLKYNNLMGIPDLLQKVTEGIYIPIDIKSGMGLEGMDEEGEGGKPKKHYAVQLALYIEILQKLGFANENKGIIIDIQGNKIVYNLDYPKNTKSSVTWLDFYNEIKEITKLLLEDKKQNKPALGGVCKLCQWFDSCKKWCEKCGDLTNIFYLGRAIRDVINSDLSIESIDQICSCDLESVLEHKRKDKSFLSGIGEPTLNKIVNRANIIVKYKHPVAYKPINFPTVLKDLFFDIETDPTQDFVYLHGIYERDKYGNEKYLNFFAENNSKDEEERTWKSFWNYINSLSKEDFVVYYYSAYEKTVYRKLQKKYPNVISEEKLENFFDKKTAIDIYLDVVLKYTDWPIFSYSLKDIATYLGFKWRDETPSGALSILWYNKYLESGDKRHLNRILEYNEDDCKALMIVKDRMQKISVLE